MRFIHPNVEKCAYCELGTKGKMPPLPFHPAKVGVCGLCQFCCDALVRNGAEIVYKEAAE